MTSTTLGDIACPGVNGTKYFYTNRERERERDRVVYKVGASLYFVGQLSKSMTTVFDDDEIEKVSKFFSSLHTNKFPLPEQSKRIRPYT